MEALIEVAFWVTRLGSVLLYLLFLAGLGTYLYARHHKIRFNVGEQATLIGQGVATLVGGSFWLFISVILNGYRS